MSPLQFVLAVLLLLATPGPTNTLLSLSGTAVGFRRSMPLMAGEIGGYLCVIVPVATFVAPLLEARPLVGIALKLAAACWILSMAARLWMSGHRNAAAGSISVMQVFTTTILNPKALIIGLAIMPHGPLAMLAPWIVLFCLLVLLAATGWILAGTVLGKAVGGARGAPVLRRVAAVFLVLFSMGMAGTAVAALA